AKDVCAIANSKGGRGYIIVGIEDKTKFIAGLDKDNLYSEEQIQQIITSRCEPPIPIIVDIVDLDNKKICIITIYDGYQKPYQIRESGSFYIRRGSTTDTMRKQELIESFEENLDFSIETLPIIKSNINLLNMDLVEKYFRRKGIKLTDINKKYLLESTGITYIDKETREEKCTLGGLLVFSDNNSICIPQNMIKITNKQDKEKYESTIISGNLLSMIDKSEIILKNILPPKYPITSIIESINNAVLYREYSHINRIIEIFISEKAVIIDSPGQMIQGNVSNQKFNCKNYNKRNMWLYEKLITLDDTNRFINNGEGFRRIKNAFTFNDKMQNKVRFINSQFEDTFKVILPGTKWTK
ncbi:MAG: putative DNA binding domain-containing protein, partial [Bacillota bacterium]|nr:putative DNA binding domain-containing protein [Bacillota bacterium]